MCKWCNNTITTYNCCMFCNDEIIKQERKETERIKKWEPPSDDLIECIRAKSFPDAESKSLQEQLGILLFLEQLRDMSKEQIEGFINSIQSPPTVFTAHQKDPFAQAALKEFFNANTIGDAKRFPSPLERGESARIRAKTLKVHWQGYGIPDGVAEWSDNSEISRAYGSKMRKAEERESEQRMRRAVNQIQNK